jgi:hypothetical protein
MFQVMWPQNVFWIFKCSHLRASRLVSESKATPFCSCHYRSGFLRSCVQNAVVLCCQPVNHPIIWHAVTVNIIRTSAVWLRQHSKHMLCLMKVCNKFRMWAVLSHTPSCLESWEYPRCIQDVSGQVVDHILWFSCLSRWLQSLAPHIYLLTVHGHLLFSLNVIL